MPPEERWDQRRHFPVLARRLHARPGSLLPLTDFVGRDGERHLIEGEVMDGVVRHVDVADVAPQRATDEEGGRSDLLDLPHHLPIGSDHLHAYPPAPSHLGWRQGAQLQLMQVGLR
jgi:hypothetical protein